jgi:hypothetical protein
MLDEQVYVRGIVPHGLRCRGRLYSAPEAHGSGEETRGSASMGHENRDDLLHSR